MTDRSTALQILAALQQSPVGDSGVLVGSSGLFGFETAVPALTEDIDIAVPERVVVEHGPAIVATLARQGFAHEPGTATFVRPASGVSFYFLGHGDPRDGDHIGGAGVLRVMVFEDISRIVGDKQSTAALPQGGRALTPAGFVASKLLTERAHKGSKDKIQALLLLAERTSDDGLASDSRDCSPTSTPSASKICVRPHRTRYSRSRTISLLRCRSRGLCRHRNAGRAGAGSPPRAPEESRWLNESAPPPPKSASPTSSAGARACAASACFVSSPGPCGSAWSR